MVWEESRFLPMICDFWAGLYGNLSSDFDYSLAS